MMIVSIAPNGFAIPNDRVECKNLRELYDVFTRDGEEEVVPVPSMDDTVLKEAKKNLELAFACEFAENAPRKAAEHVTRVNRFMALDYDKGDAQQFARNISTLRAMGGLGALSTFRHTPEFPRGRFLVALDRDVTPEEYLRCWDALQAKLENSLDPSTRSVSRGLFLWGRPSLRAPGFRQLWDGPPLKVDELLELAAGAAVARKPLTTGTFDLGAEEGAGWRAVAKSCKRSKNPHAKKALEFLEAAIDGRAWGSKGNRNEAMSLAMFYAVKEHGEQGIDVSRSVDYFAGAVAAVKRVDPESSASIEELERTLRAKLSAVSDNRQAADRFAPLLTDDGCAKSIAASNADKVRYIHSRKLWRAWDGKRWSDEIAKVYVHNAIVAFSEKLLTDAAKLGDEGDALRAQGYRLQSAGGIKAMKELLQDQEKLVAVDGDFDKDPMLLNAENGVYDFRTGTLGKHEPKLMLTKLAPLTIDPGAKCPRWDRFMDEITLGRADLAEYIHRIMGYCMTGDVSEHKFWLFTGDGRNGKGTLINTVFRMLGKDYAVKCASDMFTEKYVQKHAQETMALEGKRLAYASEVPKGAKWDLARLKSLTGGDIQSGNRMRENNTQFDPTHKLIILANDAPGWDADDKAFARRMKRVPFELEVPEGKEDRGLEAALLAEAPGIFNRLAAAVRRWIEVGFGPEHEPECVRKTTQAYREENDPLAAFLEEKCELEPTARCLKGDVWAAWSAFCTANGLQKEIGTQIGLTKRLQRRFQEVRSGTGARQWQGFALRGQVSNHKPN